MWSQMFTQDLRFYQLLGNDFLELRLLDLADSIWTSCWIYLLSWKLLSWPFFKEDLGDSSFEGEIVHEFYGGGSSWFEGFCKSEAMLWDTLKLPV